MIFRDCTKCGKNKPLSEFHSSFTQTAKYSAFPSCKICRNAANRLYLATLPRQALCQKAKAYARTFKGRIMVLYNHMSRRVRGIDKSPRMIRYIGLPILPKRRFYAIALQSAEYKRLFLTWKRAGYPQRLVPSVDRIEPHKGYAENNIRFLTHGENGRLGALSRWAKEMK